MKKCLCPETGIQTCYPQAAVLHYFQRLDKNVPVRLCIFRKASASAALQIIPTLSGNIGII